MIQPNDLFIAIGIKQNILVQQIKLNEKGKKVMVVEIVRNGFSGLHEIAYENENNLLNEELYTKSIF